ncbi:Gfo/Idh/MocA family protein [Pleomorphovibrio marinus]|uniref:Gfo/Idh/MocA family protein n=1 Tax=Pleomorphovibrio marinus TaxID=2164132 RepID=UPI000E0A819E|nr:Gfo/Idh/MocA family oxidoreductase [Pleomorphovibrio marinus]
MEKTDNILQVGVLGCGPIAQFAHLEACQKAPNVKLYAVCDQAENLAKKMGNFYGAEKVYTDYGEMLADPSLDAVIVATSDPFHLNAALQAILARKHVLVEKPLGTDLEEAIALGEEVTRSGLHMQVGHMKRFDPGIVSAKQFIRKDLGTIVAYKGWYADSTHRYDMTDSTQPLPHTSTISKKPSIDPKADLEKYYMLAHGSHLLDTARFLAGPISSIHARLKREGDMYCWFMDTVFESGANGHLDLTVAVRMDWHEGFHLYGTEGSVLGKIYNPWYFKTSEVTCFSAKQGEYRQVLDNKAHFFKNQLGAFAQSILTGDPNHGSNLDDGIASIKAMLAIHKSVVKGERIWLDTIKQGVL